jgi:type II secretory pathway pseudopilin PulG
MRFPKSSQAGVTLIETLVASTLLTIGSLSMVGLVIGSIAINNRNKVDSVQTMLAQSLLEQIHSTFNGNGTSALTDCSGTEWTIDTTIPDTGSVGSALSGGMIDFSEADPPDGYHMTYVVRTPCESTGIVEGTYDVRWHLDQIGTTNTYLITVSAKLQNYADGTRALALPVTLRFMSGS